MCEAKCWFFFLPSALEPLVLEMPLGVSYHKLTWLLLATRSCLSAEPSQRLASHAASPGRPRARKAGEGKVRLPSVCLSVGDTPSGVPICACWAATKSEVTGSPERPWVVLPNTGVSGALLTTSSEPKTGLYPGKKNVGAGTL